LIPIPISTREAFLLLFFAAVVFLIALFLPTILELKRPKDAGPRKVFEADGKEIVGFSVLLAVYFRENSQSAKLLEDIEAPEYIPPSKSFLSIALPDIEF